MFVKVIDEEMGVECKTKTFDCLEGPVCEFQDGFTSNFTTESYEVFKIIGNQLGTCKSTKFCAE